MKSIIGPVLLFCEVKKEYYILFKAQKQNHLNILNLIPGVFRKSLTPPDKP